MSVVSFTLGHAFSHSQLPCFVCPDIYAEYEDVSYHTEVRWLSRGAQLKHFSALRLEMEVSMNGNDKFLAELSNEKWLWGSTLPRNIRHHLNVLNTKFQSQQKLISDIFWKITAFEVKLNVFRKHLLNVKLCHLASCDLLRYPFRRPECSCD
jgi:hypothetical protein